LLYPEIKECLLGGEGIPNWEEALNYKLRMRRTEAARKLATFKYGQKELQAGHSIVRSTMSVISLNKEAGPTYDIESHISAV